MRKEVLLCALLWTSFTFAQPAPQPIDTATATGNEAKHARDSDARHCLDLKTDAQIIRCAERYRWRR